MATEEESVRVPERSAAKDATVVAEAESVDVKLEEESEASMTGEDPPASGDVRMEEERDLQEALQEAETEEDGKAEDDVMVEARVPCEATDCACWVDLASVRYVLTLKCTWLNGMHLGNQCRIAIEPAGCLVQHSPRLPNSNSGILPGMTFRFSRNGSEAAGIAFRIEDENVVGGDGNRLVLGSGRGITPVLNAGICHYQIPLDGPGRCKSKITFSLSILARLDAVPASGDDYHFELDGGLVTHCDLPLVDLAAEEGHSQQASTERDKSPGVHNEVSLDSPADKGDEAVMTVGVQAQDDKSPASETEDALAQQDSAKRDDSPSAPDGALPESEAYKEDEAVAAVEEAETPREEKGCRPLTSPTVAKRDDDPSGDGGGRTDGSAPSAVGTSRTASGEGGSGASLAVGVPQAEGGTGGSGTASSAVGAPRATGSKGGSGTAASVVGAPRTTGGGRTTGAASKAKGVLRTAGQGAGKVTPTPSGRAPPRGAQERQLLAEGTHTFVFATPGRQPTTMTVSLPTEQKRRELNAQYLEWYQFDEAGHGWVKSCRNQADPRLVEAGLAALKEHTESDGLSHAHSLWEANSPAKWNDGTTLVRSRGLRQEYRDWVFRHWEIFGLREQWEESMIAPPATTAERQATWELSDATPPEGLVPKYEGYALASWLPRESTRSQVADWAEVGAAATIAGGARILWTNEGDPLELELEALKHLGVLYDGRVPMNRGGYRTKKEACIISAISEAFITNVVHKKRRAPDATWLSEESEAVIVGLLNVNGSWDKLPVKAKEAVARRALHDIRRLNGWYGLWKIMFLPHLFKDTDGSFRFPNFRRRCIVVSPKDSLYAYAIYKRNGCPPAAAFANAGGSAPAPRGGRLSDGLARIQEGEEQSGEERSAAMVSVHHNKHRSGLTPEMKTFFIGGSAVTTPLSEDAPVVPTEAADFDFVVPAGVGPATTAVYTRTPAVSWAVLGGRQLFHPDGTSCTVMCTGGWSEEPVASLRYEEMDLWAPTRVQWEYLILPGCSEEGRLVKVTGMPNIAGARHIKLGHLRLQLPKNPYEADVKWHRLRGGSDEAQGHQREILTVATPQYLPLDWAKRMGAYQRQNDGKTTEGSSAWADYDTGIEVLQATGMHFADWTPKAVEVALQQGDEARVIPTTLVAESGRHVWLPSPWGEWQLPGRRDMLIFEWVSVTVYARRHKNPGWETRLLGWTWIPAQDVDDEPGGTSTRWSYRRWFDLHGGTGRLDEQRKVELRVVTRRNPDKRRPESGAAKDDPGRDERSDDGRGEDDGDRSGRSSDGDRSGRSPDRGGSGRSPAGDGSGRSLDAGKEAGEEKSGGGATEAGQPRQRTLGDEALVLRTAPVGPNGEKEAGSQASCGLTQASLLSRTALLHKYHQGFRILERMWYEVGSALGATGAGIVAPLERQTRTLSDRRGLRSVPQQTERFGEVEEGWGDHALPAAQAAKAETKVERTTSVKMEATRLARGRALRRQRGTRLSVGLRHQQDR
eukprot:GHVU01046049.1.p1 GENE.GHVU01046049.1~~GHVU01046049.1.p1  ORF type:complete len:1513 (-),score=217.24 GHVU01046049.1:1-4488(-)